MDFLCETSVDHDYILFSGSILVLLACPAIVLGLTWGGMVFPWTSYQVLVPLILGCAFLLGFFIYEANSGKDSVFPAHLVKNRTSFAGYVRSGCFVPEGTLISYPSSYVTALLHGLVMSCTFYMLPVFFEATKFQATDMAGLSLLGLSCAVVPGVIIAGLSIKFFQTYRPQNFFGWLISGAGVAACSFMKPETKIIEGIGFEVLTGFGFGLLNGSIQMPILASQPVSEAASALALYNFIKEFSEVWSMTCFERPIVC